MPDPQVNLTHAVVTAGAVTGVLLAAQAQRKYLRVQNDDGANTIWIKFGADAVLNEGIRLGPGESLEFSPRNWNSDPRVVNVIDDAGGTEVLLSYA